MDINICICGGGALGHVIAGMFANKNYNVSILTNRPQLWHSTIKVFKFNGEVIEGSIIKATDKPEEVIPYSDILLFCIPGYMFDSYLNKIKNFIHKDLKIGSIVSSTGFFFKALEILPPSAQLFGFQRVPYISRVKEYGKAGFLLGNKKELKIATHNFSDTGTFCELMKDLFEIPVVLLDHILEASLTNSNPLLHTVRLYSLFKDYDGHIFYPRKSLFYEEWSDETSDLLIKCDAEFQQLLRLLPIKAAEIPSILFYYESWDANSLTRKIRSIEAFQNIEAPMKSVENGFIPDFESRYFQEDFPYGLVIIKSLTEIYNMNTPNIDKVLEWGQFVLGKEYMVNGKLTGKDLFDSGYLSPKIFQQIY